MSIRSYIEAMERLGIKPQTVLTALCRHADYIANHGLPAGFHQGQCGSDHWEAMKYGMECRRLVEEEANRRVIEEWTDQAFVDGCANESKQDDEGEGWKRQDGDEIS